MTKSSPKNTHLTIRISSEELELIKQTAAKNKKSFTDFVMGAIKREMGDVGVDERLARLENAVFKGQAS